MRPGELRLAEDPARGRHVLSLSGEIDIANAALVERRVVELCREGAREIVLDLRGLSLIDARGLSAALFCESRCEHEGVAFSLVPGNRMVRRLFELSGVERALEPGTSQTSPA
jgi:anti-sigma B factor antagonist